MQISVCNEFNRQEMESLLKLTFGEVLCALQAKALENFYSDLHNELHNADLPVIWYASKVDGVIVGCIAYFPPFSSPHPLFKGNCSHVELLGVLPSWQRRGIARNLLVHCIEKSILDGAVSIALQTSGAIDNAMKLYESLGFKKTRLSNPPVGDPLYIYEKWLIKK